MKTALIIGGGSAGCAAAHQLSMAGGWDVTLVEATHELGDGVRTKWYGGHPYTFGPRHFLTQKTEVYDYLNKHCPLRLCADHVFITYVESDNEFYNFPIHKDDFQRMPDRDVIEKQIAERDMEGIQNAQNFEEYWVSSVGQRLYDKMINTYSKKMWQVEDNKSIDTFNWSPKGVTLKEGPRAAWDTAISAYPYAEDGYNQWFDIATADVKVLFNTKVEYYDLPSKTVLLNGEMRKFDIIISTLSPDDVFHHCFGALPYVGRDLHKIVLPMEECFPPHVYFLYYAGEETFTRLVEYKRFTHHKSPTTLIGMEIPSQNGRYYPIPTIAAKAHAKKYFDLMPDGVFSIGRAGSYDYAVDIDDCIFQAMEIARNVK